jgi:Cytochrome P450
MSLFVALKIFSLLLITYFFWSKFRNPKPRGNPLPGPAGLPIIGNLLQFPDKNPWRQLKSWADEYGPIYQISALGETFIILGSEEVCNDLLRARGDIYSDRHYITVLRDEIHLPVIKYGGKQVLHLQESRITSPTQNRIHVLTDFFGCETDTWRRQRKFFHFAQLQSHASNPHYIAALNRNVRRATDELLAAYSAAPQSTKISSTDMPIPDLKTHWHHILEAYICGVVSQLAYGYHVQSPTERYVRDWVGFYNEFEKAAEPARYAVNVFPWLRFAPSWLGPWKSSGKEYLETERKMIHRMFFAVKERMCSKVEEKQRNLKTGAVGGTGEVIRNSGMRERREKKMEMNHEDDGVPWSIAKLYHLNPSKWTTESPATNLTPNEAAYTLGAFIEASMAGTPAALKLFFQAMLWYPEWQDRIYEEICQVCGVLPAELQQQNHGKEDNHRKSSGSVGFGDGDGDGEARKPRMPSLLDAPCLPITRAVIKEMLRWRPTLPGGFPHRLMRDDLYTPSSPAPQLDGLPPLSNHSVITPPTPPYHLPASSLLLWPHYTISRSPLQYPDPETFNPARYLDTAAYPQTAKQPLTRYPTCEFDAAFGFGRRMCPGTRMAEDMMVLFVATIMGACVVSRKRRGSEASSMGERLGGGGEGLEVYEPVPWDEYDEGRPTRPTGFEFVLVERTGWRERLADR